MEKTLIEAGICLKEAKVLQWFFNKRQGFSKNIEHELSIRQPEACRILGNLVEKDILSIKKIRNSVGKGRPQHLYTLKKPVKQVLTDISNDIKQKEQNLHQTEQKLLSFADTYDTKNPTV